MKKPGRVISLSRKGQPRARTEFSVVDPLYVRKAGRPTGEKLTQWDRVKRRVLDLDDLTSEQVAYRDGIIAALEANHWNIQRTSRAIGLTAKSVYKRIILLSIPLKRRARGQEIFDFSFKGYVPKEVA